MIIREEQYCTALSVTVLWPKHLVFTEVTSSEKREAPYRIQTDSKRSDSFYNFEFREKDA
jgi:hypothetical protein